MTRLAKPALALVLAGLACAQKVEPVERTAARAAPHLASFAEFERWALRAAQGEALLRTQPALQEALFAPLRHEAAVLGAWVELGAQRGRTLALRGAGTPPSALVWKLLNDPQLGALQVAVAEPCPLAGADKQAAPPVCVFLTQRKQAGPANPVTVTMSFRAKPAAD